MRDWELRVLAPQDREAILAHWLALPAGLRYMRFGHLYPDATLSDLARALDFSTDLFCGLFSPQGELVGLAQAAPEDRSAWELAFSVLPQWQRNGFARSLGERLVRMLAARGVQRLQLRCLASNRAMQGLADALGFKLREEGGELLGERYTERPGTQRLASAHRAS